VEVKSKLCRNEHRQTHREIYISIQ